MSSVDCLCGSGLRHAAFACIIVSLLGCSRATSTGDAGNAHDAGAAIDPSFDADAIPTSGPSASGAPPTASVVESLPIEVSGSLPTDVVWGVIRTNYGHVRRCFQDGLDRNPELAGGHILVKFVIDGKGTVTTAESSRSDINDPKVISCVVGIFRKLSYPPSDGGGTKVAYRVTFVRSTP
jgi:hypothetical protein